MKNGQMQGSSKINAFDDSCFPQNQLLIRESRVRVAGGSPSISMLLGFGREAFFVDTSINTSMDFSDRSGPPLLQGF